MIRSCCNGACSRRTPIRVLMSDLTGVIYAVTRYTTEVDQIRAAEKHDVSRDVGVLLSAAWARGFDDACAAGKGDEVPNPYVPRSVDEEPA